MSTEGYAITEGFTKGLEVWSELRGEEYARKAIAEAAKDPMKKELRQFLFEHCFGSVWARPGLERVTRSVITISILCAFGRIDELKSHIRMGMTNGLTKAELTEIFLHVGVYAGVPAAVAAVRAAGEVFAEDERGR